MKRKPIILAERVIKENASENTRFAHDKRNFQMKANLMSLLLLIALSMATYGQHSKYQLVIPNSEKAIDVDVFKNNGTLYCNEAGLNFGYCTTSMNFIDSLFWFPDGFLNAQLAACPSFNFCYCQDLNSSEDLFKIQLKRNRSYRNLVFNWVKVFNEFEFVELLTNDSRAIKAELDYFNRSNRDYYVALVLADSMKFYESLPLRYFLFHINSSKGETTFTSTVCGSDSISLPEEFKIESNYLTWEFHLKKTTLNGCATYITSDARRLWLNNKWDHTFDTLTSIETPFVNFVDLSKWSDLKTLSYQILPTSQFLTVNNLDEIVLSGTTGDEKLQMVVNCYIYSDEFPYMHRFTGEWSLLKGYIQGIMKGKGKYSLYLMPTPHFKNVILKLEHFDAFTVVVNNL